MLTLTHRMTTTMAEMVKIGQRGGEEGRVWVPLKEDMLERVQEGTRVRGEGQKLDLPPGIQQ